MVCSSLALRRIEAAPRFSSKWAIEEVPGIGRITLEIAKRLLTGVGLEANRRLSVFRNFQAETVNGKSRCAFQVARSAR